MKFNVRVFFHGNLQSIRRFGQEHVSAFFVFGQIQSFNCSSFSLVIQAVLYSEMGS